MPETAWLDYIHSVIAPGTALAAALALAHLKPRQNPVRAGILLVLVCAFRFVQVYLALPGWVWLIAAPVLALAIWGLCKTTPGTAVLTSLLAGLFAGLIQMLCLGLAKDNLLLWVIDGLSLLAAALTWVAPVSLLPDPDDLPVLGDRMQRWKMQSSLIGVGFSLALADLWVFLLPDVLQPLPEPMRSIPVLFTVSAAGLLLWYVHQVAYSVLERTEALMDKQVQTELLSFMGVIRSQRHDFNFHLRAISNLIGTGKYQECNEYIQEIVKNSSALNDMLPLQNPATSALINAFQELALQKGISFDISVSTDLAKIPCTLYETNTIIGNLLQNAIDELEQNHNGGPVRLAILFRSRYYVIKVSNPCSKDPQEMKQIFRPGYSTKQSHEGLGLATVRRISERYGGKVLPEFGQGQIHLVVQIPFAA